METTLLHSISVKLANKLNKYGEHREGIEFTKLVLGIEIVLINITKLSCIFFFAIILGIVFETVLVMIGFNVLRHYAFGAHAQSGIRCAISSTLMFVVVPYFINVFHYQVNNLILLPILIGVIASLYFYAPSDTEARPLLGKKNRARLRKRAIINGCILVAVILIMPNTEIKLMLSLGAVYEAISITPITYRILKKRRCNYEKYESAKQH